MANGQHENHFLVFQILKLQKLIKKTKLDSVSVCCKCRHSKTANTKILSANTKHIYDRLLTNVSAIAVHCIVKIFLVVIPLLSTDFKLVILT